MTLKELDEVKAERFPNANRELERFYPEYLAHIHIDILEEYTGNGVCSKLMQALFEVLKEEKVPGICVLVDTNNKLCGDVDFEDVKDKVYAITPVPGGIGPMTITMLLQNTLEAFYHHQGE